MSASIQQGGDIPTLPAERGGSSSPAGYGSKRVPSTVAAASGHCARNGEQPGFSLTHSELSLVYHMLRSFPEMDHRVGARLIQVEGELNGSAVFEGRIGHAPEANREPFHEVGKVTHKFGNPVHADR